MPRYLVPDLPEVEQKILTDLDAITQKLCQTYKNNPKGILLCGGFGRGEGSIIKKHDHFLPYNDYDLLLITKRHLQKRKLDLLAVQLAKQQRIRFVDLGAIREKNLSHIPLSVFAVDLQQSQLLFGSSSFLKKIPLYSSKKISDKEQSIQLWNRLICFLELTPDSFFKQQPFSEKEQRMMVLQLSKAVIAACIVYLIDQKLYTSSYQKQQIQLLQDTTLSPNHLLIHAAYEIKLGIKDPLSVDLISFWKEAHFFYKQTLVHFLLHDQTVKHFCQSYLTHPPFHLKNTIKRLVKKFIYQEKIVSEKQKKRVEIVTLLTFLALPDPETLQRETSISCADFLFQWFEKKVSPTDWNTMKNICTKLWEQYHH